jgi:hypothetical protein
LGNALWYVWGSSNLYWLLLKRYNNLCYTCSVFLQIVEASSFIYTLINSSLREAQVGFSWLWFKRASLLFQLRFWFTVTRESLEMLGL